MEMYLTEIKNAHLFAEYLRSSGLKSPKSHDSEWELVDTEQEKVVARVRKDSTGKQKFFICAALLGRK